MTILERILWPLSLQGAIRGISWDTSMKFKTTAEMYKTTPPNPHQYTRMAELENEPDLTYLWIPELQRWILAAGALHGSNTGGIII